MGSVSMAPVPVGTTGRRRTASAPVAGDTASDAHRGETRRSELTRRPENSPDPHGTSPDRGVLDEALEPGQIRSLNSALSRLSETDGGASKEMQEAAKRLLSGRLALR